MICPMCEKTNVKYIFKLEKSKLYSCKECGLEFLEDYMKDRSKIYKSNYWVDEKNPEIIKCKEKNYKQIIKYIPKGKILDYGGGYGNFVNYLKNKGYEVDLYEPYLSNNIMKNMKYDIITLFDVIEHIVNPIEIIKELKEKLNKDGKIIIITPDTGEISNKILGKKWPHYKYEHIMLYNRRSMHKLCEKTGMKIQKIMNIKYNYNMEYIEQYSKKYSVYGFKNIKFPFKKYMKNIIIQNPFNKELFIILEKEMK
jgi:2-polyprenyl-3-methyl-5-hydroxy-6-metoxy-1,4-benzoquinol methylase